MRWSLPGVQRGPREPGAIGAGCGRFFARLSSRYDAGVDAGGTNRAVGWGDIAGLLIGVAGMTLSLTWLFLGMRAVMAIGGACADGGPYVSRQSCPDGVPLLLTVGIFGLFVFGAILLVYGSRIGGPYGNLVGLAWPALFLSLAWNFIEFGLHPPGEPGLAWGWLICGVVFVILGAGPLLAWLPSRHDSRTAWQASGTVNRLAHGPDDVRWRTRADLANLATDMTLVNAQRAQSEAEARRLYDPVTGRRLRPNEVAAVSGMSAAAAGPAVVAGATVDGATFLAQLERLDRLHASGALSDAEFASAKTVLLRAAGGGV